MQLLETQYVYVYATDFLTMALICHDAIKMGDGDCIATYWNSYFQSDWLLQLWQRRVYDVGTVYSTNRKSAELKWSRTVNTHGHRGTNVPVDLHMEHLNRRLKGMMRGLGFSITPQSIQWASKALGIIESLCTNFENTTDISQEVFSFQQNRYHKGYRDHKLLMKCIDWEKFKE